MTPIEAVSMVVFDSLLIIGTVYALRRWFNVDKPEAWDDEWDEISSRRM